MERAIRGLGPSELRARLARMAGSVSPFLLVLRWRRTVNKAISMSLPIGSKLYAGSSQLMERVTMKPCVTGDDNNE